MIFTATDIPGAVAIDIERKEDTRGFFARISCDDEFAAHGLQFRAVQSSISWSKHRGTLRGLHYQDGAHAEAKLVRCTSGAIFDVIVDLRRESPAFGRWIGIELSADNRRSLLIPPGVAHGFQSLTDAVEIHYQMSTPFAPHAARGIRWNDPQLAIAWPLPDIVFASDADMALPDLATLLSGQPSS